MGTIVDDLVIRDAVEADFSSITDVYNDVLLNSTAIYSEKAATLAEGITRWRVRGEQNYPTLVACNGNTVIGFSSFGDFRPWPGYRFTIEHSVHVHSSWRGKGVGSELVRALLPRAAALGKHVMVGGIDAENSASLRFHERIGFERVAYFKEIGFKFGRFLDLIFVQRTI